MENDLIYICYEANTLIETYLINTVDIYEEKSCYMKIKDTFYKNLSI